MNGKEIVEMLLNELRGVDLNIPIMKLEVAFSPLGLTVGCASKDKGIEILQEVTEMQDETVENVKQILLKASDEIKAVVEESGLGKAVVYESKKKDEA